MLRLRPAVASTSLWFWAQSFILLIKMVEEFFPETFNWPKSLSNYFCITTKAFVAGSFCGQSRRRALEHFFAWNNTMDTLSHFTWWNDNDASTLPCEWWYPHQPYKIWSGIDSPDKLKYRKRNKQEKKGCQYLKLTTYSIIVQKFNIDGNCIHVCQKDGPGIDDNSTGRILPKI